MAGLHLVIQMSKFRAPYLVRKRGIFYLQKRIPQQLTGHYGRTFVRKSLRTTDRLEASKLASLLVRGLEREWNELLFTVSATGSVYDLLHDKPIALPTLSEARKTYCEMKGRADDRRFVRYTSRVVAEIVQLAGDKVINSYTRNDALLFRDSLLKREVSYNTVKRNFECIRAIWNFAARESGISDPNPFANMNYGNGAAAVKRMPIPVDDLRKVQQLCYRKDDDIRWLIALLSDTGMRLAEAAGLAKEDVFLDTEIPHIRLCERPWRPLKTRSSERDVPLVGAALWAVKRAVESSPDEYLFPRYCSDDGCKADYASNSLNKWLRKHVPNGCVVHSFRHSMRDRLRAVECPAEIIDQIGGWTTSGVGQQYGEGFTLKIIQRFVKQIE
ncbi:MAG: integrase [Alphaproteobacteria bacterium]|nr:integrase [Alphaproteobacteria bacterium]